MSSSLANEITRRVNKCVSADKMRGAKERRGGVIEGQKWREIFFPRVKKISRLSRRFDAIKSIRMSPISDDIAGIEYFSSISEPGSQTFFRQLHWKSRAGCRNGSRRECLCAFQSVGFYPLDGWNVVGSRTENFEFFSSSMTLFSAIKPSSLAATSAMSKDA